MGFRVGQNADFQVQVELGPQTRTQPLGPNAEGSNTKRHVLQYHLPPKVHQLLKPKVPETPQGWLQGWKANFDASSPEGEEESAPGSQPMIDANTVKHLHTLYQEQLTMEENNMR